MNKQNQKLSTGSKSVTLHVILFEESFTKLFFLVISFTQIIYLLPAYLQLTREDYETQYGSRKSVNNVQLFLYLPNVWIHPLNLMSEQGLNTVFS